MFRGPNGAGKGDKPRPIKDMEQFEANWDAIFKKKKEEADKIPALNPALRTYDGKLGIEDDDGNKDETTK